MKVLINLQGMIFKSAEAAKEHYGNRYDSSILEWIEIDND